MLWISLLQLRPGAVSDAVNVQNQCLRFEEGCSLPRNTQFVIIRGNDAIRLEFAQSTLTLVNSQKEADIVTAIEAMSFSCLAIVCGLINSRAETHSVRNDSNNSTTKTWEPRPDAAIFLTAPNIKRMSALSPIGLTGIGFPNTDVSWVPQIASFATVKGSVTRKRELHSCAEKGKVIRQNVTSVLRRPASPKLLQMCVYSTSSG